LKETLKRLHTTREFKFVQGLEDGRDGAGRKERQTEMEGRESERKREMAVLSLSLARSLLSLHCSVSPERGEIKFDGEGIVQKRRHSRLKEEAGSTVRRP